MRVLTAAVNDDLWPRLAIDSEFIGEVMFTNKPRERYAEGTPAVLLPKEQSRLAQTQAKFRFGSRRKWQAATPSSRPSPTPKRSSKP